MTYHLKGKNGLWEVVVGLEVHCQLKSNTKLFSRSSNEFGKPQNENVSFYDNAMPGQLPVINEYVVRQAIKTGLGLNAEFNEKCIFDRKNYFYPDLPSGYQITQFYYPIIKSGWLEITLENKTKKKIRIHEAHMEQDAGKLIHDQHPTLSLIDLNRSGVCLLEIVSEPDIRSPYEAMEYLKELRTMVRALDTSNGDMEKGSMRCDANVSVRPVGETKLGTRCEMKNINSMKNVGDAIENEAKRQIEIIENGGKVEQQTRRYNALTGDSTVMRSKEDTVDYRYFPDPDLAPLIITKQLIDGVRTEMPELPEAKKARYISEFKLSEYDAGVLTASTEISSYFEKVAAKHEPKLATSWITSELFGRLNKLAIPLEESPVSAEMLIELLDLIKDETIFGKMAKDVLDIMIETRQSAKKIVVEKGLKQTADTGEVEKVIDEIIANNQKQVAEYKGGNERLFGFFVGQTMKASSGKVNPKIINDILKKKLSD